MWKSQGTDENTLNNINTLFDIAMDNTMAVAELDAEINLEMINGFKDAYEDESGIDTGLSSNQVYNALGSYYEPSSGGIDIYTKLMLHCDGTDGSTSFPDASASAHTVTALGDAQVDTAQYKFGGASALFDGTGDALRIPDSDDFYFSNQNFCVDGWFRGNSFGAWNTLYYQGYNATGSGYPALAIAVVSGTIRVYISTNGTSFNIANGVIFGTPSVDTWYHFELDRVDDTITLYFNGVAQTTIDVTGVTLANGGNLIIGATEYNSPGVYTNYFDGWIDELRITNGIYRNNSNFTPPASAYTSTIYNMTLISEAFSVASAPDTARMLYKIEEVDALTLDTDIKFYLSRDDDANRVQGTPELLRTIGSNKLIGVDFDLSSLPSDTDLVYRIVSANNKTFYAKAVSCQIKS